MLICRMSPFMAIIAAVLVAIAASNSYCYMGNLIIVGWCSYKVTGWSTGSTQSLDTVEQQQLKNYGEHVVLLC